MVRAYKVSNGRVDRMDEVSGGWVDRVSGCWVVRADKVSIG